MPPASKTTGNYVNSSLAKVEALKAGYDEAIMLAPNGLVAECTGENIFVSRNGIVLTPPLSAGALEGITQSSVMTIAADLGIDCRVDNIARSDLYIADEIFVCGTAAEISSVNSVDDRDDPLPRPEDHGDRRGLRPRRPRRGAAVQGLVRAGRSDRSCRQPSAHGRRPGIDCGAASTSCAVVVGEHVGDDIGQLLAPGHARRIST